ncbi:hypothetical protein BDV27DRAFT_165322 [Aspergillus caelatus]|uniref:Uncharacterized protein n=1 Tax=Aspergillus caelatus TaxID=61420 RepID=A0A5N7A1D2_9EURO|nr:uncharacterized protein BDV27DRAFT_165322 [Aspergillus caelatus]KAE8363612.1 hypothetical protein BDV27DRAFT_165322 [Aspergillus caelatus]
MSETETIHVVSKKDNSQHAVVTIENASSATRQLPPSSVRVRPLILSLSSNNLSYARAGELLHWWDTYPVPSVAPAPYNDQSAWGIVPAWGYATVLESTTDIAPGSTLWGFWPTSGLPTDLTLIPGEPHGHWTEVSEHRKSLMTYYNRYEVVSEDDRDTMAWTAAVRAIWGAGYLLSEYAFSPKGTPVHPYGAAAGLNWTTEDADLSSAVVVNLAASTKTARSFTYNLLCRPAGSGPLGVLQITSSPEALERAAEQQIAQRQSGAGPVKALAYSDVDRAVPWLVGLEPSKLVIIDYGARDNALLRLRELVQSHEALQSCKVVIILVGGQQKVYTEDELREVYASMHALGAIRSNASTTRDTAIELDGPEAFFDKMDQRWKQWLDDRAATVPDMRLVWGKGVAGTEGMYGGWERLTKGEVRPEEALVYMA